MQRRPVGVTLLAILFLAGAVLWMAAGVAYLMGWAQVPAQVNLPPEHTATVGVMLVVFGAAGVILGLGLWRLKNWARVTGVVLSALGVGAALIGLGYSIMYSFTVWEVARQGLSVFIRSVVLWYLTQPHVKQAFTAAAPAEPAVQA